MHVHWNIIGTVQKICIYVLHTKSLWEYYQINMFFVVKAIHTNRM